MGGPLVAFELVTVEPGLHEAQVRATGEILLFENLRGGEDGVAREERGRVSAGCVENVAQGVVADIGSGQTEAENERQAAEDDQLAAHVLLGIPVDHLLVAVDLAGVVEDPGQLDVFVGDGAPARVFDARARFEVFEVGVRAGEVGQSGVVGLRVVVGEPEAAVHVLGFDLEALDVDRIVVLVDLDLALPRHHHGFVIGAEVLARRGLYVDDSEVGAARRGTHAKDARFDLDRVPDVDRGAVAHVDVLEVGARVFGDVFDGLAESRDHHEAGRADDVAVPVGPGVPRVLRQRVGCHREVREEGKESLGHGFAPLVAKYLSGTKVLEKISGFLANDAGRHGHLPRFGGAQSSFPGVSSPRG